MFLRLVEIVGAVLAILAVVITILFGFSVANTLCFIGGFGLFILVHVYPHLPISMQMLVLAGVAVAGLLTGLLLWQIVDGSTDTATFDEDFVIVLGSGIKGDKLTPMLQDRLDTAIKYFEKNNDVTIIVSGGQGEGEDVSEALAMKKYLSEHVPNGLNIVQEDKSTNTVENLQNSKKIIDDKCADRSCKVALITSNFHIFRAMEVAKKLGFEVRAHPAPMKMYLLPGALMREVLSIIKFYSTTIFT